MELALNILDIAENSANAGAQNVYIDVEVDGNLITITVADDGEGMDEDFLKRVADIDTTTRTSRKVGMGIPLFKASAESAGGHFAITSKKGVGTKVIATFVRDHKERKPLGDVGKTMATLIDDTTDYVLRVSVDGREYKFDTAELKSHLDGISVNEPKILIFVKELINENITYIGGAKI